MGKPDLCGMVPAKGPVPAVGRYRDGRADQLPVIKMLVTQVEHFLVFLYDFRYLQHDGRLLSEWCVGTSSYQWPANLVFFYRLFSLRNLFYLI